MIQHILQTWWLMALIIIYVICACFTLLVVAMDHPDYHGPYDVRRWIGILFWPIYIICMNYHEKQKKIDDSKRQMDWAITEIRDMNRRERGEFHTLIAQNREMMSQLNKLVAEKEKQSEPIKPQ